jgi:hypothetical protein
MTQIRSKLVVLALHFPRMRVIWSRSPYETAQLFQDLKVGRDEPLQHAPAGTATPGGDDDDDDDDKEEEEEEDGADGGDAAAAAAADDDDDDARTEVYECIDVLKTLPGITDKNAFHLLRDPSSSSSSPPISSQDAAAARSRPQNLAQLAQLDTARLAALLHSPADAAVLHAFLHHNFHAGGRANVNQVDAEEDEEEQEQEQEQEQEVVVVDVAFQV